jgi:hypothetical protein
LPPQLQDFLVEVSGGTQGLQPGIIFRGRIHPLVAENSAHDLIAGGVKAKISVGGNVAEEMQVNGEAQIALDR